MFHRGTSYLKYRHIILDHNVVSKVPMKGLKGKDAFFTSSIMRGWVKAFQGSKGHEIGQPKVQKGQILRQ